MKISNKLLNEIGKLSIEDLIELNHQVVSVIRHKRSHDAYAKAMTFKVGDKVAFSSKRTGRKVGEIIKRNPRKAVVAVKSAVSANGKDIFGFASTVKWSVPYEMLTTVAKG